MFRLVTNSPIEEKILLQVLPFPPSAVMCIPLPKTMGDTEVALHSPLRAASWKAGNKTNMENLVIKAGRFNADSGASDRKSTLKVHSRSTSTP